MIKCSTEDAEDRSPPVMEDTEMVEGKQQEQLKEGARQQNV